MTDDGKGGKGRAAAAGMALWIPTGAGIGICMGQLSGNLAVGIALGMGVGVALGAATDARARRRQGGADQSR
ncbi:hypothetical protein [Streptomyces sp. NPDC000229]|uniref:hypothetical protein n=1 Tax=Streptomyces sp. NPDC000229 TaxID=3154247 RepID=UPI003316B11A